MPGFRGRYYRAGSTCPEPRGWEKIEMRWACSNELFGATEEWDVGRKTKWRSGREIALCAGGTPHNFILVNLPSADLSHLRHRTSHQAGDSESLLWTDDKPKDMNWYNETRENLTGRVELWCDLRDWRCAYGQRQRPARCVSSSYFHQSWCYWTIAHIKLRATERPRDRK